jgi:exopolysaccharide biosynthesis protein
MQAVVAALLFLSSFAAADWKCINLQTTTLAGGAIWKTENCTNDPNATPLLTVNSITVDLTANKIRAVPAVSIDAANPLQPINRMAAQNENFIAGINGGYFWRVDISGVWIDDVCRGKIRKEAEMAVSPLNVNFGVSDGLVKVDGKVLGNNCNCTGYSRPAILEINGQESRINVVHRGETSDHTVRTAIGAGPNLVSFNFETGESFVDIPADDDNINILEHAANTAVGLQLASSTSMTGTTSTKATTMIMITTDGSDECGPKDITCGLNSKDLASLMKDHFNTQMAMSMDQGGSTTMWVKGASPERDGIVSRSHNTEPVEQDGPRNVANGLFFELL